MSVNLVPFTAQEHAAMSPMGYFIHTITTDYTLTLLRKEAPPLRIQKGYTPVPVTAGERAEEEAQEIRNMRGTDPNWRWNGPPIPETKPPFSNFYPGEDGTIWVKVHQPGKKVEDPFFDPSDPDAIADEWREPILFDVFAEDGSYLGAVRAPDGLSRQPQPHLHARVGSGGGSRRVRRPDRGEVPSGVARRAHRARGARLIRNP